MEAIYGCSQQGQRTLIYRGYEYRKDRDNVCGTTAWRCKDGHRFHCKARLVSNGTRIVGDRQPDHTHAGNMATSLARKAVGEMKNVLDGPTATVSSSQAAVISTLDDQVLMALPRRALLARTLQRRRQKLTASDNDGNPLPPAPVNMMFDIPNRFADMILFDSGPGKNRIILLGCQELLDGLARADLWLADGTFKVVPTIFFQLYSIHFNFGSGINPAAVYCLLNNKTAESYVTILRELKNLVPLAAPRRVLVDFERAAMNAFHEVFPIATVTGCYFHLSQSIIRKAHEVGLKLQYENSDQVRDYVRSLCALAFVPPGDVLEAFELLVEVMPAEVDHLDELTTFFEHTYIRGRRQRGRGEIYGPALFPIDKWNQHASATDGIARTTNSVEGWHHGLQSLFLCHHPTTWTFLDGLKRDMQKQKTHFLQGATGLAHPSAKRYRKLNERVERAVAAYGRSEILVYLRAIAHLSHT